MTKDAALRYIVNNGYRVTLQMGNYPSPSYYIATPRGSYGRILRGTANGIAQEIKRLNTYNYAR